jgi:hypothetical protein
MSIILAYGSFQRPAHRDEMTPVRAVSECSWKELVTYGVRVPTQPEANARMKQTNHILYLLAIAGKTNLLILTSRKPE